jgi:hypothetical protein
MVPTGNIGRRKRDGNHSPPKNKDPDSHETKINSTKEPNEAHKNILQVINENFKAMLLDMVNQNV